MLYDVAIIGAGPAGMMAGISASKKGARVLLVEKNKTPGLKLLMTGHGRCNLTNIFADKKENIKFYGKNFKFLISAFNKLSVDETLDFFAKMGVAVKVENNNRVFPQSNKASDVQKALLSFLKLNKVEIILGTEVKSIVKEKDKIIKVVLANNKEIFAKNFIIATGGKSYPATGSSGDAYAWLTDLGHNIITPRPALTPVIVKEKFIKDLEGLSLSNVEISVHCDNKKVVVQSGDILFTSDGLSGPLVLNLSSCIGFFLPKEIKLKIDFFPKIKFAELEKKMQDDFHHSNNKIVKNYLSGFFPFKLISVILRIAEINGDKPVNLITKEERRALALAIKEFTVSVVRLKDFDKAMITAGGVDIREVDPKTMRSRLLKNLYFAGEILDLDGPTGGYNLQICWSTGYTAGDSVIF